MSAAAIGTNFDRWQSASSECGPHLLFKKCALALVIIANLSAISWGIWEFGRYADIALPTEILVLTPVITGAIWGMEDQRLMLYGISHSNYTNYLSPQMMMGRFLSFLFFFPLRFILNRIDLTDYRNPAIAKSIIVDMSTKIPIENFAERYGARVVNLARYGLLSTDETQRVDLLCREYLDEIKPVHDFLRKSIVTSEEATQEPPEHIPESTQKDLADLQQRWDALALSLSNPTDFDNLIVAEANRKNCIENAITSI